MCKALRIRGVLEGVWVRAWVSGRPRVAAVLRVWRNRRIGRGACSFTSNRAWWCKEVAHAGQAAWRLRSLSRRYWSVGILLSAGRRGRWKLKGRETWSIRSARCEAWTSHRIRPRVHVGRRSNCGSHDDGVLWYWGRLAKKLTLCEANASAYSRVSFELLSGSRRPLTLRGELKRREWPQHATRDFGRSQTASIRRDQD